MIVHGTLLFDFDSTLINCESLDLFFKTTQHSPVLSAEVEEITRLGMEGKIDFATSLAKRLALLNSTAEELDEFAKQLINSITPGMPELITWAQQYFDVWIVSGGLTPLITPVADRLNIDKHHIKAVEILWHGQKIQPNPNNGFATNKIVGAQRCLATWKKNITIIGDGYTDFQLFESGIAQHFIAYCQHIRRHNVINATDYHAYQPKDIKQQLELLYGV